MKRTLRKIMIALPAVCMSTILFAQKDSLVKEFKPSGKVWGYAFGDIYYKMHSDSANRGGTQYSNMPEGTNAFELRRAYLGYDYNISEHFSSELLLAYEGQTNSDGTRGFFLKAANVRWKDVVKGNDLIFGLQATPAFPMLSEKLWGYRSIEKTVLDMRKGAGSADLGIGLQGHRGEKTIIGYNILVANGSGTKLESNIFKKMYGDVYVKLMDSKLVFDLYADYERTLLKVDFHKDIRNFKFTAFYTTDAFTFGIESYIAINHNAIGYADTSVTPFTTDTTDGMGMGTAVYLKGRIIKDKLGFFVRADMFNPDLTYNNTYVYSMGASPVTEMFMTAGVDYTPVKNVHIMPNLWVNSYSSREKNATGKIKSDYDMVPRLTFWYVFK